MHNCQHFWLETMKKYLVFLQGLPFAPLVSDYFGRRATLFVGSCIMLVGVGVQTAAYSVTMFIAARVTSRSSYLTNIPSHQIPR